MTAQPVLNADAIAEQARALLDTHCPIAHDEYSPLSKTLHQLASLVIIESRKRGLNDVEQNNLWDRAISAIVDVHTSLAPSSEQALKHWEKNSHRRFWSRLNPSSALESGDKSVSYFDPNIQDIEVQAGRYLQFSWLAHPTIDFAIVDALVTAELCAYGEHVKQAPVFGLTNNIILGIARARAEGDAERLVLEVLRARAIGFLCIYALPVGFLLWLGIIKQQSWAIVAAVAWGLFYVSRKLWNFLLGIYRRLLQIKDPYSKAIERWTKMLDVHRTLDSKVLSPTNIKLALATTRNDGAVWSQAIDAIVERRARESRAWIIEPSLEGIIDEALDDFTHPASP